VTGNPLFVAPRGRSWEEFEKESRAHGWPSFRDEEVVWDHVRCLPDGEAISQQGTHLGHNLPDRKGNRYCINLVSGATRPRCVARGGRGLCSVMRAWRADARAPTRCAARRAPARTAQLRVRCDATRRNTTRYDARDVRLRRRDASRALTPRRPHAGKPVAQ
jgi:hypothetical protein